MEEAKNKKNYKIFIIILLLLLNFLLGLGLYKNYYDQQVKKKKSSNNKTAKKYVPTSFDEVYNKKVLYKDDDITIEDLSMFQIYKEDSDWFGPSALIFNDGGYKVSDLDDNLKFRILYNPLLDDDLIEKKDNLGNYYIKEEKLKEKWEETFGPNTYHPVDRFYGYGYLYVYDPVNKQYNNDPSRGEIGGGTCFSKNEDVLSVNKDDEKIEIVTSVIYDDCVSVFKSNPNMEGITGKYYKDYNKTKEIDYKGDSDLKGFLQKAQFQSNYDKKFFEENKDSLEQYTYTYIKNPEDGKFYIDGVRRTNEAK